jgi:hypothetical protein
MKTLSIFLASALAICTVVIHPIDGVAQTSQQNSEARKLFIEGRDLQDDGKFADAEKKFREALTKYPKADQSDRTAYYLIATLVRLGRAADARNEIDTFRKNYPQSTWKSDVDEKALTLGATANTPFGYYVRSPFGTEPNLHIVSPGETHLLSNGLNTWQPGVTTWNTTGSPFVLHIGSSTLESELLRLILEKDAERGIEVARERLKTDPADPAVISNLGTIANSSSAQALPFLMGLVTSSTSNPNAKSQALFWATRRTGDKDQMAKALMDMLSGPNGKETETVVADVLNRVSTIERRNALTMITESQNAERVNLLDRLYRAGGAPVRLDIVRAVGQMPQGTAASAQGMDRRVLTLLTDAAQNDKDTSVRRTAIQALATRKDVDVKTLESLLRSIPRTETPQPAK